MRLTALTRYLAVACVAPMIIAWCLPAEANTTAYWRFEGGPDEAPVAHGAADGVYAPDVPDLSGNGNDLSMFTTGGCCGFGYDSDVPGPKIIQTGAANNFSVQNTGGFPAAFNTSPGGTLSTLVLPQWTIEASWKPEVGGYRTLVGRDGQNITGADGNLAALYLQAQPDDSLAIKYVDEAGFFHVAASAPGIVQGFTFGSDPEGTTGTWHNIAAVSDGLKMSLYLDVGAGYNLVAQTDLTLSGSPNTALTDGSTTFGGTASGPSWNAGDWTVGRGLYAGGHTDRAYGLIDEVRISDMALKQNQFLFAVPEPGVLTLLALGGLALIRRRGARH